MSKIFKTVSASIDSETRAKFKAKCKAIGKTSHIVLKEYVESFIKEGVENVERRREEDTATKEGLRDSSGGNSEVKQEDRQPINDLDD